MEQSRPVNLDFKTLRFPITAIVSILHRISGVINFLALPFLLWMLHRSLESEAQFAMMKRYVTHANACRLILFGVIASLTYHLFAGFRHVMMDFGCAESLKGGRISAYVTLILSAVTLFAIGVWLW